MPSHQSPNSTLVPISLYAYVEEWGERTVHLGGDDGSGEDTPSDRDHTSERALLVDVRALDGRLWCTETQTNILIPSPVPGVLAGSADLVVEEDMGLSRQISIAKGNIRRRGRVE